MLTEPALLLEAVPLESPGGCSRWLGGHMVMGAWVLSTQHGSLAATLPASRGLRCSALFPSLGEFVL